jgi:excisionase family DNA binding protein
MNPEKKWLSIREAADYMGMSVSFVRRAVRQRIVPFARVGSKVLRFDKAALQAWMEANGAEVNCGNKA